MTGSGRAHVRLCAPSFAESFALPFAPLYPAPCLAARIILPSVKIPNKHGALLCVFYFVIFFASMLDAKHPPCYGSVVRARKNDAVSVRGFSRSGWSRGGALFAVVNDGAGWRVAKAGLPGGWFPVSKPGSRAKADREFLNAVNN